MENELTFKENNDGKFNIKFYKHNFIERILIWLKIIKDKRYDGKKISWQEMDEMGVMGCHNIDKRWEVNKRYIIGCDTYDDDIYCYILVRKVGSVTEILLNKTCRIRDKADKDKFEADVNKLAEYFNCEVIRH